jgi:hypothetical protein
MIDDLINVMQGFINMSKKMQASLPYTYKPKQRWRKCMELMKDGWKAECVPVPKSGDLIFVWRKDGEEERVRLSFIEQCQWLDILQDVEENDDEGNRESSRRYI